MTQIMSAASLLILLKNRALHIAATKVTSGFSVKRSGRALRKLSTYPDLEAAYASMHVILSPLAIRVQ